MKPQPNLKLIALLLPDSLSDQVKKEQFFIAKTWGPKHALRTPPHITLIPPISVTDAEENSLQELADKISKSVHSFTLHLHGYGSFRPKVIFIHAEDSTDLNELQTLWRKELLTTMPHVLDQYPERPFHPHVTLAHRDMNAVQYKVIQEYYSGKNFFAEIVIKNFYILKHCPDGWEKEKAFYFNNARL